MKPKFRELNGTAYCHTREIIIAFFFFATSSALGATEDTGKDLFKTACAACHGESATGGRGPGLQWLAAKPNFSPKQIAHTIRMGRASLGMPSHSHLSDRQISSLVSFLVGLSKSAKLPGDPVAGKKLFFSTQNQCFECHSVRSNTDLYGPSLKAMSQSQNLFYLRSMIQDAQDYRKNEFQKADSNPKLRGYLPVSIFMKSGVRYEGLRVYEDAFTIQFRLSNQVILSRLKSEIGSIERRGLESVMPRFIGRLSDTEINDLLAFIIQGT